MYEWSFPICDGGSIDGPAESGMATFKGNRIPSLGKELVQNSLDASNLKGKPVHINFELKNISLEKFGAPFEIYRYVDLISHYENWNDNESAQIFIKNIKSQIALNSMDYLTVSDFNTSGLSGAGDKKIGPWGALVKATGINLKNQTGTALGSHGIGKSAAFANSTLNMVFYSSLDATGVYAFQGVTRLISFEENGIEFKSQGYWGVKENKAPIIGKNNIPKEFLRTEIGTSVIIPAFIHDENWVMDLAKSIISSFYVPLLEGQLTITICNLEINKDTIFNIVQDVLKQTKNWDVPFFIEAILSPESKKHVGTIIDKDDCSIYVLEGEKYNKTCALLRGLGMQIFTLTRFKSTNRFIAVFRPQPSSKLDKILRGSENPEHDKWQGDRYESDPKYAKQIIKKTEGWIRSVIKELTPENSSEKSDLSGMSNFFPDESSKSNEYKNDTSSNNGDINLKRNKNSIGDTVTLGSPSQYKAKKNDIKPSTKERKKGSNPNNLEEHNSASGEGIISNKNKLTKEKREDGFDYAQSEDTNGDQNRDEYSIGEFSLNKVQVSTLSRVISTDPTTGKFILLGNFDKNKNYVYAQLKALGDDGEMILLPKGVKDNSGKEIPIDKLGRFGPINVVNGKYRLELILDQRYALSIQVESYEAIK